MGEHYWKDSPTYNRILEILTDYWIDQPDELVVGVRLSFTHSNGERQHKELYWVNPNYERIDRNLKLVPFSQLLDETAEDRERKHFERMNPKNYRRIK